MKLPFYLGKCKHHIENGKLVLVITLSPFDRFIIRLIYIIKGGRL